MGILQLLLSYPVRTLQMHLISSNIVTSCANICVIETNDKLQYKKNQKERKKDSWYLSRFGKQEGEEKGKYDTLWGF